MAFINTLRNRMGKIVVVLIGASIASFILADLFGPGSSIFGDDREKVGEIDGQTVKIDEFQQKIEELRYNQTINSGRNPSDDEMNSIRSQAWEMLINEIAFQNQYDELGLQVTEEEIVDMVQGKNIHPQLKRAFTNPETGQFDKNMITNYLKNLNQMPQEQQASWYLFEQGLKPTRLRTKYNNLISNTTYVTDLEAKQAYTEKNKSADIEYIYIPAFSVPDSAINVSESDIKNYYNEHKSEYETDGYKSINYVTFPVIPTPRDTASALEDIESLKQQFFDAEDDSLFARINAEGDDYYRHYNNANLPEALQEIKFSFEEGAVYGPMLNNGKYFLYKIADLGEDTAYVAKASHILIKSQGQSDEAKADAKQEAQRILKEIQQGADFASMAKQYGQDGTSAKGGDLGWFSKGQMVPAFEDAVFNQNSTGLMNKVVETRFGYHIIKVSETKTNDRYTIATIDREIIPSDDTRDKAYRQADLFATSVSDIPSFEKQASENKVKIYSANQLSKDQQRVGSLGNARQIVRWAYNEGEEGKVSSVFELTDNYLVAVVTESQEEGYKELDAVRDQVISKVNKSLKGDLILDKLNALDLNASLADIKAAYGDKARVKRDNIDLESNSIPDIGFSPIAVGKVFGLSEGERTKPFKTENGVAIIELQGTSEVNVPESLMSQKQRMIRQRRSSATYNISQAIKDKANIEDQRYKFY